MSRELLIEIGTEELPASFMRAALQSLEQAAAKLFAEARLQPDSLATLGSPRRLALRVQGLPEAQPDLHEEVTGPPWSAAFESDGSPKKAAIGFAKKNGVAVEDLQAVDTDKGKYVSAQRHVVGGPTADVLLEILPRLCQQISFPKSMRWGAGDFAFGRPIHWLVGLLDQDIVPFEFAGLKAGRSSRGHRFLAPDTFDIPSAQSYEETLQNAHVVVNVSARKARMHQALLEQARALGGELIEDPFLLDECASLVEEPFIVPGGFEPAYLELPQEVVVSVMRDHQRYFAIRSADGGGLLPHYLNVVNTANDPKAIARGNDRVLRARLADARFFVEEDRKAPLEARLDKLASVVFQAKLGTMGAKVARIERLASSLASEADVDSDRAVSAARLCKADLETLIVYEFPELQGEMGRFYALAEGIDAEVADAIRDHYRPQGADDELPATALSAVVAAADRADTLVGCFGIGLTPTGSADPFALRRAALGLIRIAFDGPIDIDIRTLLTEAHAGYDEGVLKPSAEVIDTLDQFVRGRLRAFLKERFETGVIDACLGAWDGGSLRNLLARVEAVNAFRDLPEYEALAVAFKRAYNISHNGPRGDVDPQLLEDGAEQELARSFADAQSAITAAQQQERYADALGIVARELRTPIDRFFEDVFVMVDDPAVRDNRLRLLGSIADTVSRIAHFHEL